jgi:hypothetical protein
MKLLTNSHNSHRSSSSSCFEAAAFHNSGTTSTATATSSTSLSSLLALLTGDHSSHRSSSSGCLEAAAVQPALGRSSSTGSTTTRTASNSTSFSSLLVLLTQRPREAPAGSCNCRCPDVRRLPLHLQAAAAMAPPRACGAACHQMQHRLQQRQHWQVPSLCRA